MPVQLAFTLLRRSRPRRYVDLLSRCDVPEIVSGILAEIQRDATAIAEVIRTAPSAVEGNRWNGAILAPIMLQVAYWHLTERVLRDDGDDATLERSITTPLFLRIVHSLIEVDTPSDLMFEAIPEGCAGLSSLVANASAIGRLDPRFAQQTAKAIEATRTLLAGGAV